MAVVSLALMRCPWDIWPGGQQELSGMHSRVTHGCSAPGPAQGQRSPALGAALSRDPWLSSSTSAGNAPRSPQGDHLCLCHQASYSFPKSRGSFDCVRLWGTKERRLAKGGIGFRRGICGNVWKLFTKMGFWIACMCIFLWSNPTLPTISEDLGKLSGRQSSIRTRSGQCCSVQ